MIERKQILVGSIVAMETYTAHTFYLEPGSIMTCIASHPYDQEDVIPSPWLIRPD